VQFGKSLKVSVGFKDNGIAASTHFLDNSQLFQFLQVDFPVGKLLLGGKSNGVIVDGVHKVKGGEARSSESGSKGNGEWT
jgi:hypothetical protein